MIPTCSLSKEDLIAYLDGTMTAKSTQEIASHIQECDVCKQRLVAFTEVDQILQRMPLIDDAVNRAVIKVQLEVAEHQKRRMSRPMHGIWFGLILFVVLIMGLVLFL